MSPRVPLRVFVVDDSAAFRRQAADFISSLPETLLAGTAVSGREALERLGELPADIVLVDLIMPGLSGLEVARLLRARPDAPAVILLTLFDGAEYRQAAHAAGARALIPKADFARQLPGLIAELRGGAE